MIALSTATTVTAIVAGFFVVLALLAALRTVFRKGPPTWHRYRVGVFLERNGAESEERDG